MCRRQAIQATVTMLATLLLVMAASTVGAQSDPPAGQERAEQDAAEKAGQQIGKMHQDQEGKDIDAGLSWRVALLPYLGHRNLYRQFHHNEPWNSPHNRKLIPRMPAIYKSSPGLPEGKTTFVALVSDRSVVTRETGGIRLSDVRDGASNTILFVSANRDHAVTWTRPEDIDFDPENPFQGLDSRSYFLAVFVDGSVHRISTGIGQTTMKRLVYRNDAKPVSGRALMR